MQKGGEKQTIRPPQKQELPGEENKMTPRPVYDYPETKGSEKLKDKVAFITGGDSGIGKAVAILFAKEGADIAIAYLNESADAEETRDVVENTYGRRCLLIETDLSKEENCIAAVEKVAETYGRIDILVNNAAVQYENKELTDLDSATLLKTFETNIFNYIWVTKASLKYIPEGGAIINSSSVTAYRGSASLVDYASTKGAIVSFTRSMSSNLVKKKIRVNGVAPGPIWTPLIPATFDAEKTASHGSDAPMERAGEPVEVAPCYLFLACRDSSYMTGQFLHPNGGEIVNG